MFKHGRVALLAIAISAAPLAAHAQGDFFLGGQVGRARVNIDGLNQNTASTQLLELGYRWQAGPYVQVGVEGSLGKVGTLSDTAYYYDGADYATVETTLAALGANARFQFGPNSHFFAVVRAGVVRNKQDVHVASTYYDPYSNHSSYAEGSGSSTDVGGYAGAGIGYDITSSFNISAVLNEYVFANSDYSDGSYNGGTLTVGAELRF